jgi:hypothetical protein
MTKCYNCGKTFTPARSDARTCSAACRVAVHRARGKQSTPPDQRPTPRIIDPIEDEWDDDAIATDEERWQRSAENFLADILTREAYWNREFGKGWRKFQRTSSVTTLAKEADEAFAKLVAAVAK